MYLANGNNTHNSKVIHISRIFCKSKIFENVKKKKPLNLHGYESSISTKCERLTFNCCMALSEGYCLKINPNCKERELHYPNEFLQ